MRFAGGDESIMANTQGGQLVSSYVSMDRQSELVGSEGLLLPKQGMHTSRIQENCVRKSRSLGK